MCNALRYPDFICIGAQKAGTSWLHQKLEQHPTVWVPTIKELHYFNRLYAVPSVRLEDGLTPLDRNRMQTALAAIAAATKANLTDAAKIARIGCLSLSASAVLSDEWYGTIFNYAPRTSLCGEITPEYALLPDVAVRHMLRLQPRIKVIFILRDPIERAWSQLRMMHRNGNVPVENQVQFVMRNEKFFAASDYMATILRFRRYVPAENFLLLYFDDIAENPYALLREVCQFLELNFSLADFKQLYERENAASPQTMEPSLYAKFREKFEPIYAALLSLNHPVIQRWHLRHYGNRSCHPEKPM